MNWKLWTIVGVIALIWGWIFFQLREKETPIADSWSLRGAVANNARSLLLGQDFSGLETELEHLRKDKSKMPDGSWQLSLFFNGLYMPANPRSDAAWTQLEESLNSWEQAYPASVPVKIAKAGFLRSQAERERRRIRDLPEPERAEPRKAVNEKFAAAAELAEMAMASTPAWPEAFRIRIELAGAQGLPFDERKALVERAAKAEPSYVDYYYNLLWAYNPQRKEGAPDKTTITQYADWCAEIAGRSEAKNVYARVAGAASRWYGDDFFAASGFDWPKVRDAFKDLTGEYSKSSRLQNQYCRLACLGGDKKLAKKLFERIGNDYDNEVWRDRASRDKWREWAGVKG